MMEDLSHKRCIPCEGGTPPASEEEIQRLLPSVPGWALHPHTDAGQTVQTLQRTFVFEDFRAAMRFLRQAEEIAEAEGHHPDFCVHYNRVDFILWTHAVGGLHENDFILAAKVDEIAKTR